jgi:hypothetical protein
MMKIRRTDPPLDVECVGGLSVQPLRIDAETGAVISAVCFDARTQTVFIVDNEANPPRGTGPGGQVLDPEQ